MSLVRSTLRPILVLALILPALLAAQPAQATHPGRNGLIAWSHPTGLTTDSEVFVMLPDGSVKRQLTHNPRNDFFPAWSPDGRAISFDSSTADDVDVWILDRDGERNLTNDPGWANLHSAWSPDGTQIAYSRQSPFTGVGSIWVIDVDGTDPRQVSSEIGVNNHPTWSPDGRWILFSSDRDGNLEIYAVRPDGTGERRLTNTPTFHEDNPNFAPDGSKVAFDACQAPSFPCPGSPDYEIFTINVDGPGLQRLTVEAGIDWNPAWSPDGTQIVYRSDQTGFTHVWKMNADGSGKTQLTFQNFTGGVDPDWQPLP